MKLYYHPRSTYSQKVLLALHEKEAAFEPIVLDPDDPDDRAALLGITPLGQVPVLVLDDGWKIPEASIIIEYLDTYCPGPPLIPASPDLARQTRFHDRLADLYVNDPVKQLFADGQRPPGRRDPDGVALARRRLDTLYTGFDLHLARRTWLMGETFTMADCALVPALGVARLVHPFDRYRHLSAYARRAFARPSFQRVAAELALHLGDPGLAS